VPIVGGLDIHREQITFDYLDIVSGQVQRGQITPADREHLRAWLARFAGVEDVAFAVEGCTGWRYVAEELAAAGVAAHLAEPADTAFARGRKRHAKTDKTDCRHLRMLLAEGRLPECWIPPGRILEARALLELYYDLRAEHTAWVQRIHAVLFHQGVPALGEGTLRTGPGLAGLRDVSAACLSPAGQLQVATALEVLEALEARLHAVRHQLLQEARQLAGAKGPGRAAVRGRAGHRPGDDLLAGRGRPVLLLPPGGPVRRAGCHGLVLGPQGAARAAVPAGTAGAALGRLRGRQDPRPCLSPRPPLLRPGQGPLQRQARRAVRGPQDPPPGPSHPR
jgi:Transposase